MSGSGRGAALEPVVVAARRAASGRRPSAVAGGTSARKAYRVRLLLAITPSAPRIENLYAWPSRAFGDDALPDSRRRRRARAGRRSSRQSFQSPITETPRAFGAQTAKRTPLASSDGCAPSRSYSRSWRPSPSRWRSSSPGQLRRAGSYRRPPAGAAGRPPESTPTRDGSELVAQLVDELLELEQREQPVEAARGSAAAAAGRPSRGIPR